MDTLAGLQGPGIMWGSDGPLENPPMEESDIRGQETYSNLIQALNAAGLAATLSGPGPFTLFAPTNSAITSGGAAPLTADNCAYHVVPGAYNKDAIGADLVTLQGESLKYKRFARQTFVDDAVVGLVPQGAATGVAYPQDIQCDNGVIHCIDKVLSTGYFSLN